MAVVSDEELADLQRAADHYRKAYESAAEAACTLFDCLALDLETLQDNQPYRDNPTALAFKAVIQEAWFASENPDSEMVMGDLKDALAHPVIAALLDAWAHKEG